MKVNSCFGFSSACVHTHTHHKPFSITSQHIRKLKTKDIVINIKKLNCPCFESYSFSKLFGCWTVTAAKKTSLSFTVPLPDIYREWPIHYPDNGKLISHQPGLRCCIVRNQPHLQASYSGDTCGLLLYRLLLHCTPQPAIHLPVWCNDDHRTKCCIEWGEEYTQVRDQWGSHSLPHSECVHPQPIVYPIEHHI